MCMNRPAARTRSEEIRALCISMYTLSEHAVVEQKKRKRDLRQREVKKETEQRRLLENY